MATTLANTGSKSTVRDLVEVLDAEVGRRQEAWAPSLAKTGMSIARFRAGILQAVRANPRLLECGALEIINAAAKALALGLDVSGMTGEAYLIGPLMKSVRKGDKWEKVPTCELWRGVHGVVKLCYRSGLVRSIQPAIVREGDDFDLDLGADVPVRHKPKSGTGLIVAWYAQVKLATGGSLVGVIWRDEADGLVDRARERLGNAFDKTPWATHPDEMLLKTAVMRSLKWAPKSVEQADLLTTDEDYRVEGTPTIALVAPSGGGDADEPTAALGHEEPQTLDVIPEAAPAERKPRKPAQPPASAPQTSAVEAQGVQTPAPVLRDPSEPGYQDRGMFDEA